MKRIKLKMKGGGGMEGKETSGKASRTVIITVFCI